MTYKLQPANYDLQTMPIEIDWTGPDVNVRLSIKLFFLKLLQKYWLMENKAVENEKRKVSITNWGKNERFENI